MKWGAYLSLSLSLYWQRTVQNIAQQISIWAAINHQRTVQIIAQKTFQMGCYQSSENCAEYCTKQAMGG